MILWPLHFERSSVDHLSYQATLCLGLEIWQVVPRPLSRAHRAHKVHKIHTVLHRAHLGHTRDTEQTRHTGHQKTRGHLAQGTLCLRLQIWQVVARLFFSTAGHCFYLRSSGSIGAQSGSYLIQGILHSVQGTCTQAGNCLFLCL